MSTTRHTHPKQSQTTGSVNPTTRLPGGRQKTIIVSAKVVYIPGSYNAVSQSPIMDKGVGVACINHYGLNFYESETLPESKEWKAPAGKVTSHQVKRIRAGRYTSAAFATYLDKEDIMKKGTAPYWGRGSREREGGRQRLRRRQRVRWARRRRPCRNYSSEALPSNRFGNMPMPLEAGRCQGRRRKYAGPDTDVDADYSSDVLPSSDRS